MELGYILFFLFASVIVIAWLTIDKKTLMRDLNTIEKLILRTRRYKMFEQWQPWWDVVILLVGFGITSMVLKAYEMRTRKPKGATRK